MRVARPRHARHKTLRSQADVSYTFGPLLIPLALLLVGWGGVQLERAISHPLETDAAAILANSVLLASGLLLGAWLLWSFRAARARAREQEKEVAEVCRPASVRRSIPVPEATSPRPFHRFYVDDVRISR